MSFAYRYLLLIRLAHAVLPNANLKTTAIKQQHILILKQQQINDNKSTTKTFTKITSSTTFSNENVHNMHMNLLSRTLNDIKTDYENKKNQEIIIISSNFVFLS